MRPFRNGGYDTRLCASRSIASGSINVRCTRRIHRQLTYTTKVTLVFAIFLCVVSKSGAARTLDSAVRSTNRPELLPVAALTATPPVSNAMILASALCPTGWDAFNGRCYLFDTTDRTWDSCRDLCSDNGADMFCVSNAAENNFILTNAATATASNGVWIGLNDISVEGSFVWEPGCSSTYLNWNSGEPNDGTSTSSQDCGTVMTTAGFWDDKDCTALRGCGCQKQFTVAPSAKPTAKPSAEPTATPSTAKPTANPTPGPTASPTTAGPSAVPTIAPTGVMCPSGWQQYGDKCYSFNSVTTVDWLTCQSQCASNNAQMLCMRDLDTNTYLRGRITGNFWIGLNDRATEGVFVPSGDCTSNFRNWDTNQPDNYQNNEDCTEVYSSGKWNDNACSVANPCVCEQAAATRAPTVVPTATPTVTPTVNLCAAGWEMYNSKCYYLGRSATVPWSSCVNQCTQLGANMLCIDSAATNSFIAGRNVGNTWIGYNDINVENSFVWYGGTCRSTYTNWRSGEPSNSGSTGNEDCVTMEGAVWNDAACSESWACACEYSVAPSTTPTVSPSAPPTLGPTAVPTLSPSCTPTATPSAEPSAKPSSSAPSAGPTCTPTAKPTTGAPTVKQYLIIVIWPSVGWLEVNRDSSCGTGRRQNFKFMEMVKTKRKVKKKEVGVGAALEQSICPSEVLQWTGIAGAAAQIKALRHFLVDVQTMMVTRWKIWTRNLTRKANLI
jgi:hypothetical protein